MNVKYHSDIKRDWVGQSNCLGLHASLMFPSRGGNHSSAKEVCKGCEVRAECLEYAITNHETHGVWGGLSARERKGLTVEDVA